VALDQIILLHEKGDFKISVSQEDCHTAIENYLVREVGEVGKKIHTARSRNDQVLTALRLYYKDELNKIKALAEQWIDTLNQFAKEKENIDFPGYTHMQKAMPSSISMWAGAYVDSMKDDLKILNVAKELIDQSPLGSAAGYGVPIKIDIEKTGKELGFAKVQKNPIACQLSRGKLELSLLHCLSQLINH
jgi:argininosuccinate lyase